MSLSPRVQILVDQMLIELGIRALAPQSLEINLSREGVVLDVKPVLRFAAEKKKSGS